MLNLLRYLSLPVICTFLTMAGFSVPALACPDGQSEGAFGWCYPNIPNPIPPNVMPRQLECAQWTAHPMYVQTVSAINAMRNILATRGITNADSCRSNAGTVAGIISDYYDRRVGAVASNLLKCACSNSEFAQAPAPAPTPTAYPCHGPNFTEYPGGFAGCFPVPGVPASYFVQLCTGAPSNNPADPYHSTWVVTGRRCQF